MPQQQQRNIDQEIQPADRDVEQMIQQNRDPGHPARRDLIRRNKHIGAQRQQPCPKNNDNTIIQPTEQPKNRAFVSD